MISSFLFHLCDYYGLIFLGTFQSCHSSLINMKPHKSCVRPSVTMSFYIHSFIMLLHYGFFSLLICAFLNTGKTEMSNTSLNSAQAESASCRFPCGNAALETNPRAPGKLNQRGCFKQQCRKRLWLRADVCCTS